MSTAVIEQQAKPKMSLQEHRKLSAEERKGQLGREIGDLVKERTKTREEVDSLKAERNRLTADVERIKGLEASNADLLDRLAAFEIAEATRQQDEQAVWNQFYTECEAVRKSSPEFDEALRRIADIPTSWVREIVRMPNPAGFVLFLGGANQFLQYLGEVKPEVAVKRIRQAGYDIHHKLPKFQGGD
jgi:hypothetical protein